MFVNNDKYSIITKYLEVNMFAKIVKFIKDFLCLNGPNDTKSTKSVSVKTSTTPVKTSTNITEIEGIGEKYAEILKQNGVSTVESLLKTCRTKVGRDELSKKTSLPGNLILKWTNHADLFRINGVAGQFAELLEASGVDTVVELSNRNPENLVKKMTEVNGQKNLTQKVPTLSQVTSWVEQAKKMPRGIEY